MKALYLATPALLLASLFVSSAQAMATIDGTAVGAVSSTTQVGDIGNGDSLNNAIEYYIPLSDATNGIYGVGSLCGGNGAGTCADSGYGSRYDTSNGLLMNIYFDMTGQAESTTATLSFEFDDLDLMPDNDPNGFFESISLSYWNWNGASFDASPVALSPTIKNSLPAPAGGLPEQTADDNLVVWDLDLAAVNALNASAADTNGFWIQLGFGSFYDIPQCGDETASLGGTLYASYTSDAYGGAGGGGGGSYRCKEPWNTPEYLTAALTVSPVPVPAAVWLFGTALIGFIGMARRTRVS